MQKGTGRMRAAIAAAPFSLLGLGDIAIPGLLACLALRWGSGGRREASTRWGGQGQGQGLWPCRTLVYGNAGRVPWGLPR